MGMGWCICQPSAAMLSGIYCMTVQRFLSEGVARHSDCTR